ncbi:hypothetical protein F8388_019527 [Cannabis sativa]|uniref:Uncharacterized protein n=1 Tax=Cannabis sativa TaxID=3483 RepID=A0A7J6DSH1_CANSA|nr:hypothetical protein F8388_019527 [Cannabis sativa]KAF4394892.1 hypothetical protein G4B88_002769 [Cannabis sativa]
MLVTSESTITTMSDMEEPINVEKLRAEFLKVLRSRRSTEVPLSVEAAKPVTNPLIQEASPPRFSEAMASCPKAEIENLKDLLQEENLYLTTEAGEQGRLPVLIISLKDDTKDKKRPAIVFLHSTNKCKEWLRPLLEAYASRGFITIAIDSRYHGERASSLTTYKEALISSWKKGDTMPFIFDTRYSVVAPVIGVQAFQWAIENDMWQARVDSIKPVFEEARIDLGKTVIDKELVKKVWDRIAPGLAAEFDSPYTVPAIAPRPLLIVNGAEDPRCPYSGLSIPCSRAQKAYEEALCADDFKFIAEPGIGHQMTPQMVKDASDWFDKYLKP